MARCFPDATDAQWNDWKWQLRMRIRDAATLARVLNLTDDERSTVNQLGGQTAGRHHAVLREPARSR